MLGRWLGHTIVTAIVLITPINASAAANCAAPPGALGKYAASTGADKLSDTAFFEAGTVSRTIGDFGGEALIINFWATWCAPCVEEMPALDRLAGLVDADGMTVVAISADREGAPVVQEFYDINGLDDLGIYIDKRMAVYRALSVPGLPTTVLVDRGGQEVGRVTGVAEWDDPAVVDFLRRCLGTG